MRTLAAASVAVFVFVFGAMPMQAQAVSIDLALNTNQPEPAVQQLLALADTADPADEEAAPAEPQPVQHAVRSGESLSTIAKQHDTTWKRLYDKNANIANPDVINPGDVLLIPDAEEVLESRALPTPPPAPVAAASPSRSRQAAAPSAASVSYPRGNSDGNRYTRGNCTWHVKSLRPDLPNNLGNANTWAQRAASQGIATGSTPRVGAAAQSRAGMHVAYVTGVNADGTVNLSEMNRRRLGEITTRTAPANQFVYIY